ncbi:Coiled-coil and C2 domain-containing protein 1B [Willisornis vidua]|uniref:Coiled-coil and C2 domain-containing protein 1B n=1 Tax=Willisornis vidua TaxID=1566151 RepID=A0ABQ9CME2_9PASS|nr:Coiled-coil and C2 domain-containing protein 1B [Willisornis vidua]
MLGRRAKKSPQAKGQGAAVAKQLGLFVDFNPEEMLLGAEDGGDDGDLEAELAALTGAKVEKGKSKPKGKTPLPMDHIEKMAAECMKDLNEDEEEDADDEDLEKDTDLLAELQEVLGEEGETGGCEDELIATEPSPAESPEDEQPDLQSQTLETMLAAVKKGKKINEEEMPPPVATGKSSCPSQAPGAEPEDSGGSPEDKAECAAAEEQQSPPEAGEQLEAESLQGHAATDPAVQTDLQHTRAVLLMRQKEYKLAALKAKQQGDLEKAKEYMRTGKKFNVVLEALDSGQPIDLENMPPSPQDLESLGNLQDASKQKVPPRVGSSQDLATAEPQTQETSGSLQQPRTVLEALQQRLDKYRAAAAQARAGGDERKGRMHDRIAKQYQDAIRAHKAGRKVNFSELPVPPGFPPLPGVAQDGGSTIAAVLESASKLANMEEEDEEEESEALPQAPVAKKPAQLPGKPTQVVKPLPAAAQESPPEHLKPASPSPLHRTEPMDHLPQAVREQLEFLENRKKQYLKAAIKAKKENNLEQAKTYLRTAKGLDLKIEQAKGGKPVDISKLPSPPTDDEGDFIFVHHEDVRLSQKADEVYAQLVKLLKDQHERCLQYSKQFMHLGNVAETTRFEKLAQGCKKDMEILQLARAQGMDPPSHHFEERTFKMIRIFSELNSTEMHLLIVRGINLPAPPGVSPRDLDAFVKFEFQYPSAEQPQKSKTPVINNNNSPEYNQLFKLNINRNHRGFRRAIRSKGIKFEVFHKGSFFRSDKQVGTAHLKLDKLESECEVREIIEIFDGRKPTGGKLEVKVRLREPLSGQDLQTVTENWLVLEH